MPRPQMSVVMRTREAPERNSAMMASRSFWGMSPCMADTVKFASRIFVVSQSTFFFVLQKMTAWEGGQVDEPEQPSTRADPRTPPPA